MPHGPEQIGELVEDFLAMRRRGEWVSVASFAARHAGSDAELVAALEAAELLEEGAALHFRRAPLGPEEELGPFLLVRELGRGGMGVVFEALERPLGRRVALKLLPSELVRSPSARARFRREAELAARLSHQGICTVYGAGIADEQPWISMRLIEGESLASRIRRARASGAAELGPRASVEWIARTLAAVARALESAHAQGIVHRDVKPSNVMVTPSGEPVLFDFGLALEQDSDAPSLTRTGETAGTPAYLAPEIVGGELRRPDAQSDVYSLGVTLWECLALRPPFEGPTPAAVYQAILHGAPPPLARLRPGLPRDLVLVAATAMERDRTRRYARAADLASDLEALVEGRPVAARPIGPLARLVRWARREPRAAALVGALCVAGLALALVLGVLLASRDEVLVAERAAEAERLEREIESGFSALTDGAYERAEAHFDAALAQAPGSIEALGGRVLVSLDDGQMAEALRRLDAAPQLAVFERMRAMVAGEPVAEDPAWLAAASPLELLLEGARLLGLSRRSPPSERPALSRRALAVLDQAVLRSRSARVLYHVQRAEAAQDSGDPDAARSAAAALLALWPDSFREVFVAGTCLIEVDPPEAARVLSRAVALDPTFTGAHLNLGNALLLAGDAAAAEPALRRALELDPRSPHAHNGLGLALFDLGRTDEARQAYEACLGLDPAMSEAWKNLATLEAREENNDVAEEAFRQALALDPNDAFTRNDYAVLLYRSGDLARAREEFESVVARDPEDKLAWQGLAWTLLDLGEPERALEALERGRAPGSATPELIELRARIEAALASRR